jgi:hypothetical protein
VSAVVPLHPLEAARGWHHSEFQLLLGVFAAYSAAGAAEDWSASETELDDPQFFVLGTTPDDDCLLAISRVGRLYVLEDGAGGILAESENLKSVTTHAIALAHRPALAGLYARIVVGWYALRETVEEKLEPLMAEPMELLTHFAPQLAAIV